MLDPKTNALKPQERLFMPSESIHSDVRTLYSLFQNSLSSLTTLVLPLFHRVSLIQPPNSPSRNRPKVSTTPLRPLSTA